MGVFGAFFGCIGDGGFSGCCSRARSGDGGFMLAYISACRGVIGFNVAKWPCSVHEEVHPARPDGGCEREKVRLASPKWAKNAVFRRVGRVFRGRAGGGAVLGEFCRTNRYCARSCRQRALPACNGGGFALHEAVAQRVASVSDPHVVQFPPLLSAACGFVCAPGFPRVLMGAHTFSLRSRNVTVSQVCSRHIQCRLCHRIRAGTPAQSASITSTTTRP